MRKRLIILGSLIVTLALLTPHIAHPESQDEPQKNSVQSAVDAGVEYLKQTHLPEGAWAYQGQRSLAVDQVIGCTALCGITLMECRVPTTDLHIKATASAIRTAVSNPQFNYNYGVCLCLLFLDRLHRGETLEHKDSGTIIRLAKMIAGGQSNDGGWGYYLTGGGVSDNSNTQFAIVALWVARKYKPGAAIDNALKLADAKFRKSQRPDGGWGYDARNIQLLMGPTGAMTCAGLLGIAMNARARQPMETGFQGPGSTVSTDTALRPMDKDPHVVKARAYLVAAFDAYIKEQGAQRSHITYFFWSLERVAMFYRWKWLDEAKTIDWHDLGSNYLIGLQDKQTGAWNVDVLHGPAVDTSFSLLFLVKSDLLKEEALFVGGAIPGGAGLAPQAKKPEPPKSHEQIVKESLAKLPNALPNERVSILNDLRDATIGKESILYTNALLDAIDNLDTPTSKELAREALAGRIQRMSTKTVNDYIRNENRELRLAATRAAGLKTDLESAAELIPLLDDKDDAIAKAALKSLEDISQQSFGKSISRWNRWLEAMKRDKKP